MNARKPNVSEHPGERGGDLVESRFDPQVAICLLALRRRARGAAKLVAAVVELDADLRERPVEQAGRVRVRMSELSATKPAGTEAWVLA